MAGRFLPGGYPSFDQCSSHAPLASFWPPHFDTPYPLDPFSQSVSPPGISSRKAAGISGVADRHSPKKGKVISIPVQDASVRRENGARSSIQMDRTAAAVKIQSCLRGYLVRRYHPIKHLRTLAAVKQDLANYEKEIQRSSTGDRIRKDPKERLKITEGLMALLLQLDAIQGASPEIRDLRKATTKQVIQLQETVDALVENRYAPAYGSNDSDELGMVSKLTPLSFGENCTGTLEGASNEAEMDDTFLLQSLGDSNSNFATGSSEIVEAPTAILDKSSLYHDMGETRSYSSPDISNLHARSRQQDEIYSSDRKCHAECDEVAQDMIEPDQDMGETTSYSSPDISNLHTTVRHQDEIYSNNRKWCAECRKAAQDTIEPECGHVQDMEPMDIYQERASEGTEEPLDEEQHLHIPVDEDAIEERCSQPQHLVESAAQVSNGSVAKEQIVPKIEGPLEPKDTVAVDKFLASKSELSNEKHVISKSLNIEKIMETHENCSSIEGRLMSSQLLHFLKEQSCSDRQQLEQLTEENKIMRHAIDELCKKNETYDLMISLLNERVEQLENQVTRQQRKEERPEAKKRSHSDSSLSP